MSEQRRQSTEAADAFPVTIVVSYREALRLSFMASFPGRRQPIDEQIARKVDAAVARAEEAERE